MKFSIPAEPASPPVYETVPDVVSPTSAEALETATQVLVNRLSTDRMWAWIQNERLEGRPVNNVDALIKARGYDIIMEYSGDFTSGPSTWLASLFFTAVHTAVERVLGNARLIGLIM